jgi:hypothetical protein
VLRDDPHRKAARPRKGFVSAKEIFAMTELLMPKATAVWLVENTALTFKQIADFCGLHELEIQAIADDEADRGIKGLDPMQTGQLSREDIEAAEADPKKKLKLNAPKVALPAKRKKGPRYTPVSRRQDRPNAILWLVRNHPELKDAQVIRLVGTTKTTIAAIRDRTHWNAANLTPIDPVALGLCSQLELDHEVQRAMKNRPQPVEDPDAQRLLSAEETTAPDPALADGELDPDTVLAKLRGMGGETPHRENAAASDAGPLLNPAEEK